MIPYSRQQIDEDDVAAVVRALKSDWLTTGPAVAAFEEAFALHTGAAHAVAVNSGTAALHACLDAIGVGPGDEVIVPAITFAATANAAVFLGAKPIFADVDPLYALIDPASVARLITPRTKAVVAVDYAGQPCDYDALRGLCSPYGLRLVADACHALGGADEYGRKVGTLADLNSFSLHAVKPITTGEGGVVTTDDPKLAARMRQFRNHGISTDARQREMAGAWHYEMEFLGYNYRITDIQCALGTSQLAKLGGWVRRRQELAAAYDRALAGRSALRPVPARPKVSHARHLYPVRIGNYGDGPAARNAVFKAMRARGIGVNVHYIPVHLHPYYRRVHGTGPGLCPVAEAMADQLLSLPLFPALSAADQNKVGAALIACTRDAAAAKR
jgi:perosamine synthetase